MPMIKLINDDSLIVLYEDITQGSIDLVFADIPYPGMKIHDGSTKKLTHKGWFKEFGDLMDAISDVLSPTGVCVILLNSKESCTFQYEFVNHVHADTEMLLVDQAMWLKPSIIPGKAGKSTTKMRQAFDPILVFAKDPAKFTFNAMHIAGDDMREMNGGNAMHINIIRHMSGHDQAYKAAVKKLGYDHKGRCPEKLVQYFISLYTNEGDTVLDPFLGSGTTAAACKRLRRNCIGVDINTKNIKLAKQYLKGIRL